MNKRQRKGEVKSRPDRAEHAEYRRLWVRTPGIIGYVLVSSVLAWIAFCLLITGLAAGVGLLIVVIGIAVLVATMWIARGFAMADTGLLRMTGLPPIPAPQWDRSVQGAAGTGLRRFLGPLGNSRYWVALTHQLLVQPVIATFTLVVMVCWLGVGLGGVSYFAWREPLSRLDAENRPTGDLFGGPVQLFGGIPVDMDPSKIVLVESAISIGVGVLLLITLPWIAAGCAHLHYWPARTMLGRWSSDDLVAALREENLAREAAIRAEGRSLHRLERDLHDGPQQRLVRLQMDLAAMERRIAAADEAGALELAQQSRAQAQSTLDELRALSSGVAPPLLTDRGLTAALTALAAGSPVPVEAELVPGLDGAVGPEAARALYFVVAELLTNVAKHSGAATAALTVTLPAPDRVRVEVSDDGNGGARLVDGHGLAGLVDRLRGLHGTLVIAGAAGDDQANDESQGTGTRVTVALSLVEPKLEP